MALSIVPAIPVSRSASSPRVHEWQIRQVFFKLGLRYVGIQESFGILPCDLVLFQEPAGSTLSIPITAFQGSLADATMFVRLRVFLKKGEATCNSLSL